MKPSFDIVWKDLTAFVSQNPEIRTLSRGISNTIIKSTENAIFVKSEVGEVIRELKKEDFRIVWDKIIGGRKIGLKDITEIIGKRAIILSLLAQLPYVQYHIKPRVEVYVSRISAGD